MVEVMKSSFIPKKEIKKKVEKRSGGGFSVFFLVSLVVFLSTIIGAVGVYMWQVGLQKSITKQEKVLKDEQERIGISTFDKFIKIDKRIRVGEKLLKKHYAIAPIFRFLDQQTIPDIVFTKFNLSEDGDYIKVEASGKASAFSDLVRQKVLYTQDYPNIEDFVFTNITRAKKDNRKIFDMSFRINKKWLTTDKLINE